MVHIVNNCLRTQIRYLRPLSSVNFTIDPFATSAMIYAFQPTNDALSNHGAANRGGFTMNLAMGPTAAPTTQPTTSAPTPQPTPATSAPTLSPTFACVTSGPVIAGGPQLCTFSPRNGFTMRWSLNDTYIAFEVEANNAEGWVGLGFTDGPTPQMPNSYAVIGYCGEGGANPDPNVNE